MKTTDLVIEAQQKAEQFEKEINNVLKEIEDNKVEQERGGCVIENTASKKVAVIIIEFANLMEEVYKRIIKRQTSKKVVSHRVLNELRTCNVDLGVIHCLSKMKQFRNRIAHSTVLEGPVINYFTKENVGIERIAKIKYRMNFILENARDDVEYAYVFVEAS